MSTAPKSRSFLKFLITIGIIACFGYFCVTYKIFNSLHLLSYADAKQSDIEESRDYETDGSKLIPDDMRASSNVDWSVIYGGNQAARNRVSAAILEASQTYGVNADLIRAVIMAESVFNPQAVSGKGARGLMQLMPGTQKQFGVYSPHEPRENILGGAAYLSSLLKEFNGDTRLALAAYNAGPARVRNSFGSIPVEVSLYVNRVMSYYKFFGGGRE